MLAFGPSQSQFWLYNFRLIVTQKDVLSNARAGVHFFCVPNIVAPRSRACDVSAQPVRFPQPSLSLLQEHSDLQDRSLAHIEQQSPEPGRKPVSCSCNPELSSAVA